MGETPQTLLQDQYNTALVSNVFPPDWVNPEPAKRYNLVIIGGGPAGLSAARCAAELGAKVALVESHLLGGNCLNTGSVPSKSLIRSARTYAEVYTAGRHGVRIPEMIQGDFSMAMTRLRRIRSLLSTHDAARRLRDMGVDIFFGRGHFTRRDSIEVAGKTLRFSKALIATGSRPVVPPIEGLERVGYLTNETVFGLTQQPRRLAVIGAGPIGCEMAQAFCRLGSEVVLIEREPRILPGEDSDATRVLGNALQRDDVAVKLGAIVTHVRGSESEKTLHLRGGQQNEQVTVDEILVCVGRAPNTDGLDLAAGGVKYEASRGIVVDDYLRTSNSDVYAAGDVCTRYRFTHVADAMARMVLHNALFHGRKRFSEMTIPWCIYTDPAIARVGLSCEEAQKQSIPLDTYTVLFHTVDRAVIDGDEEGLLKIHVHKGKDRIAGATIIGRQAGDMISEVTLAMVNGIGLGRLADVIHPHPTHAEAIRKAGDLYNRTRLTPLVQRLLKRWLAWTR